MVFFRSQARRFRPLHTASSSPSDVVVHHESSACPEEELSKVMYRLIDTSTYNNNRILVVGGGDSSIEAAVGLSIQKNNIVTLSYRREGFTRIKERNKDHIEDAASKKRVNVIFNSEVKEIRESNVVLATPKGELELPNEFVFIFAGGEMPFELLKKIGVSSQMQEIEERSANSTG